jgi:beta-glucosidase
MMVSIAAPPTGGLPPAPPSYLDITAATTFTREDFAVLYGAPLPENVVDAPGGFTVNTPISDLHTGFARVLLRALRWGARRAVGGRTDTPDWALVESTIDVATPRMLSMFLGPRVAEPLARLLVRSANRARR